MIKMIVSDFDLTLINYRDGFSEEQLNILRKLKNKGIIFSLVTGRNVNFFKLFPELFEIIDYIVSSNGGAIYYDKNNKFIYNICIKEESLDKLINYGIDNNFTFIINELDKVYKYGTLKKIDSIDFDINRQYFCEQIIFYIENIDINKVMETFEKLDGVTVNNVNKKNNRYSIDINDSSVSKGSSLLYLCNYLNISVDDVLAFGDGENDISMFKIAGKKVAVDNACLELKKYADEIINSCYENGVFKYIENNILK